ncbi:MAG: hypothetical protein Homavirus21_3 [Homavirus sp.]|uniref:Apple domain-containing protein n=1 Tax=Homavirus sp. TaxID=2487769 RepID=A0A3G5A4V2_9VIRU|nr:MAG: hypothetical protein Homavirus21_3 [Homavirus sp.]
MIVLIIIILLIVYLYNTDGTDRTNRTNINEGFQYLMIGNKDLTAFTVKAVEYIPITKDNNILHVDVLNYDECFELCRTTPDCDALNYSLEKCTLYTKLQDFKPSIFLYRDW